MSSQISNTAKPKYRFVNDPDGERISTLRARIGELEAENARLKGAISWAMGEGDSDFGDNEPVEGRPRYWWRKELRRRASSEREG